MRDLALALAQLAGDDRVGGPVDPDRARDAARDIVSGDAYRVPSESFIDRAISWVAEKLGDLVGFLLGGSGPGSVIGTVVALVVTIVAVWFIVRALRVPRARSEDDDSIEMVYGTETRRDVDVWRDEARRLAGLGDFRGSIRCWHQATVAGLVTADVVDDVPGRTAGEYRRDVDVRLSAAAIAMGSLTDRFESTWYGGSSADASDEVGARHDAEQVLAATAGVVVAR